MTSLRKRFRLRAIGREARDERPSPLATRRVATKMWIPRLNAVTGSIVVTFGFWLVWGEFPLELAVAVALGIWAFLAWQGTTSAVVWAWATLLLGLESLTWPIVTMVRIRMASAEPTEQEMGTILTSVLFGLLSSIFWMTFSYGIYNRFVRGKAQPHEASGENA